jgi:hypothetical protein
MAVGVSKQLRRFRPNQAQLSMPVYRGSVYWSFLKVLYQVYNLYQCYSSGVSRVVVDINSGLFKYLCNGNLYRI